MIDRKHHEVGTRSDGATVKVKWHGLIKAEIGEHYQLILCPALKIELSMHDAFKEEPLNVESENAYVGIYYYFIRANLKWCLFKRQ